MAVAELNPIAVWNSPISKESFTFFNLVSI